MEAINLNLIPNGTNPVVHCSQYDEGREFRFNLFDGASVFVLDGMEDISCDIKKPDGNIVTAAVPNTEDDYIIVTTTLQMTACSGNSLGTINISKGGINLYTLNFVLYCERSPLENGIESESSIHNLESMVDGMVAEDVAEQYDSANVIFDNEPTSGHGTPYTVTSEGIKTAIDNAFDYDNTASGSLVHIEDGADNIPVKALVSQIVAVESGSGTKSPTNPYTISGFNNGVVSVCGVNLWDEDYEVGGISTSTGLPDSNSNYRRSKNFMPCRPNIDLFSYSKNNAQIVLYFYDKNQNFIGFAVSTQTIQTTPTNCYYFKIRILSASPAPVFTVGDVSINYPSSDTQYHAYNGNTYTFTFGQTVYGGHFDNKGNLVVTHSVVDLSTLGWVYQSGNTRFYADSPADLKRPASNNDVINGVCSHYIIAPYQTYTDKQLSVSSSGSMFVKNSDYTDATAFINSLSGAYLVYELANPIVLSITSQDIPTLLGENNIYSNCGNLEVNYYTSKSNDILEFVDSEICKKNGTNIPIEANSQDSIKDYIDNVNLSGLPDTDISGETSGQILAFDGANWVNTNQIVVKYEEKDIAFGADGEGTLFTTLTNVINVIDVTSDTNYVGYFHYFARGGAVRVKPFNRAVTGFDSSTFANTTRKVGIYYLDNIATQ